MSVDECPLRQTGGHGEDADEQPDAIADVQLPEHVEQQDRNRSVRARTRGLRGCEPPRRPPAAAGPTGASGPRTVFAQPPETQLFAFVDEVDEVARIRPSIEVGAAGREAENRYPDSGDGGAQKVPHQGRYRPLEG